MSTMRLCASQHRVPDTCLNPALVDNASSHRFLRMMMISNNNISSNSSTRLCCSSSRSSSSSGFATQLRATALDQQDLDVEDSPSGVSYELLKEKLEAGEWEAADSESRRLLCELAGEAAAKRKWVYFSEVQFIPPRDLQTLDSLWRKHSGDKFGFSVQRRIWKSVGANWSMFFRKVGWTRPLDEKNDAYRKFPVEFMWDVANPTPEGHLPLTNCLRGTQLLQEILSHPVFEQIESSEGMSGVLSSGKTSSTFL